MLATLDTALDKILSRAHEFYEEKEELKEFLKDRDTAKTKLLDALIAKRSNYLADLMNDANYYADQISKGFIDAYQLASKGLLGAIYIFILSSKVAIKTIKRMPERI